MLKLAVVALVALLQDQPGQMPKPGPEHELLKQLEGDWDVSAKFWMAPGQPPMESKGTEKARMGLGGFWLTFEFKGRMGEFDFEGQGSFGYAPAKKKYVGHWIDNGYPHLFVAEGEIDKTGKIWTMTVDSVDPQTGAPTKEKWVTEVKDKDTKIMTFWQTKDGKDTKTGEITYTRKK